VRVLRSASTRAAPLPEQSMVASQPAPSVRSAICAAASSPAGTTWSTRPSSWAMAIRCGAMSVPITGPAPIARPNIAAARPTGPNPVTSSRSRPDTSRRSSASYAVPKPQDTNAPSR
jgi:hypothetical protein